MKHRSLSLLARTVCAAFVILIFNLNGFAAIRYVTPTGAGNQTGDSWLNASPNLQEMIDGSDAGDQVWVKEGTYKPTDTVIGSSTRDKTFLLRAQVKVYGGFAGTEPGNATGLAMRKPGHNGDAHNPTILSGDLNGDDTANFGNRSDNVYHVVLANDGYCPPECEDCVFACTYQETDDSTLLDGFIIKGGSATGTGGVTLSEFEGPSDRFGGGFFQCREVQ
jgi:hypothetical protein